MFLNDYTYGVSESNTSIKTEKLFNELQNDILDEYNNGNISSEEMANIIKWCEKMKKNFIKSIKSK